MKPTSRAMGSTLVAQPAADPSTTFWRWSSDYLDVAIVRDEARPEAAEEQPTDVSEAWSMVWRIDVEGRTVTADLRGPSGHKWRYDRLAGSTTAVDLSDFRFFDQAQ